MDEKGEPIPPGDFADPGVIQELAQLSQRKPNLTKKVKGEVMRLVCGQHMNASRAQAVKRVVRRIRALMGPEAPSPKTLKWWAAEMIGELEHAGGMVKLGILRTIAEVTGLLAAGGGLAARMKQASPKGITFSTVPGKPVVLGSGQPSIAKVELTKTTEKVTITPEEKAEIKEVNRALHAEHYRQYTIKRLEAQVAAEEAAKKKGQA